MKTIYNLLLSAACFIGAISLQSCGPRDECPDEEPSKTTEYKISADSKTKIPFSGEEILTFISNAGDTAVLVGNGKRQYMNEIPINRHEDPGCPFYDYKHYETIEYKYNGTDPELNMILFKVYQTEDARSNVDVNIGYNTYETNLEYISYEPGYTDSVQINGNVYYGITIHGNGNDSATFLYHKSHTFLKIRASNKTWLKKE